MANITGIPKAMIVLGVLFVIGLDVIGSLQTTANALDLGTSGNSTRGTLFTNIYRAFDLAVIAPIVLAAVALVTIVAFLR